MVEVVSEPAERLGDQHCRGGRIGEGPEANPLALTADEAADCAAEQRTIEGVPAVPNREDVPQVGAREEVIPEVRAHVIDPSPGDSHRYRPEDDVEHDSRLGTSAAQPSLGDDIGRDDPGQNEDRIGVNRQRTQVEL